MSFSRRFFVVGSGGLISAAFIKQAREAIADTGRPLLLAPAEPTREIFVEWTDFGGRLHLGTPEFEAPPAPLWIEHLRENGHSLSTPADIINYCDRNGFTEDELWGPLNGYDWEDYWERAASSEARAYHLLNNTKVFPGARKLERQGKLTFQSFPNPMSSAHWVEVEDPLSVSLLQARLNELELGIVVRELEA